MHAGSLHIDTKTVEMIVKCFVYSSSAIQFLCLIQSGVRSMRKHEVHLQSQRGISCVQQEFSSSVGANHRHCLLVKAHLQEDNITTNTSDRKLTLLAVTWCTSLHGLKNIISLTLHGSHDVV